MPTLKKAMMCYVNDWEGRLIRRYATRLGMSVSKYLIFSALEYGRLADHSRSSNITFARGEKGVEDDY